MTPPTTSVAWFGNNRRTNSALNRLARQHYDMCRNAGDAFELAAQLESLGYNRYRVSREFGFKTTFDLAEQLFAITPRRPRILTPIPSVSSPVWWHVASLFGVLLTFLLYARAGVTPHYSLYAWLLTWTLAGTYFLNHMDDADLTTRRRVFSWLLGVGLVGILALLYWLGSGYTEVTLALLWWQLPATFWLNTLALRQRLRHFIALLLAVFAFFIPLLASCLLLLLAALLLFAPFLSWPTSSTYSYLANHAQMLLLPTLLGLGQSLLLLYVSRTSPYFVQGFVFILLTVVASGYLSFFFKRSVAIALWEAKSSEAFRAMVFRSLEFAARVLIIALFLAVLVLLNILLPLYSAAFLPYTLLALAFSLSFLLLDFNDIFLPATAFIIASLLVLAGIPFLPVVIALTAILGLGVVLYMTKVERYASELL
jgi:hypothetical protein